MSGDWREDAACRGKDPSIFYIEVGKSADPAREICATCPVVDRCATAAVSAREPFGVWGGLTPRERGVPGARRLQVPTHCPQGHPYDEANTQRTAEGHRRCRTCRSQQDRDRRERREQRERRAG